MNDRMKLMRKRIQEVEDWYWRRIDWVLPREKQWRRTPSGDYWVKVQIEVVERNVCDRDEKRLEHD